MHPPRPAEVTPEAHLERCPERHPEPRPDPAGPIPRTSDELRETDGGAPVAERSDAPGRGAASYQLRLFSPAPSIAPSEEEPGTGPVRVHLCLPDAAVLRTAWAAVSGQPGLQVVSTVSVTPVAADVRVETVAPPRDRPAEESSGASPPGAARLLSVIPEETDDALRGALSRGAWAAVREADIPARLVPDLLAVGRGECPILRVAAGRPALAAALVRLCRQDGARNPSVPTVPSPLTERETAILEAIALGHTSATIAQWLGIGVQTVKNHVAQALRKTDARTRAAAVAAAYRHGWLVIDGQQPFSRARPE